MEEEHGQLKKRIERMQKKVSFLQIESLSLMFILLFMLDESS